QARGTTVVTIQIHPILHAWDTEFAPDAMGRICDSLLLEARQLGIAFFPCRVNLVTGVRSHIGEGQHRADCSGLQRWFQFLRQAREYLESDFLLPRLDPAYYVHGRRRWLGSA